MAINFDDSTLEQFIRLLKQVYYDEVLFVEHYLKQTTDLSKRFYKLGYTYAADDTTQLPESVSDTALMSSNVSGVQEYLYQVDELLANPELGTDPTADAPILLPKADANGYIPFDWFIVYRLPSDPTPSIIPPTDGAVYLNTSTNQLFISPQNFWIPANLGRTITKTTIWRGGSTLIKADPAEWLFQLSDDSDSTTTCYYFPFDKSLSERFNGSIEAQFCQSTTAPTFVKGVTNTAIVINNDALKLVQLSSSANTVFIGGWVRIDAKTASDSTNPIYLFGFGDTNCNVEQVVYLQKQSDGSWRYVLQTGDSDQFGIVLDAAVVQQIESGEYVYFAIAYDSSSANLEQTRFIVNHRIYNGQQLSGTSTPFTLASKVVYLSKPNTYNQWISFDEVVICEDTDIDKASELAQLYYLTSRYPTAVNALLRTASTTYLLQEFGLKYAHRPLKLMYYAPMPIDLSAELIDQLGKTDYTTTDVEAVVRKAIDTTRKLIIDALDSVIAWDMLLPFFENLIPATVQNIVTADKEKLDLFNRWVRSMLK